jgi:HSP20 family molecular chaperone IbpA
MFENWNYENSRVNSWDRLFGAIIGTGDLTGQNKRSYITSNEDNTTLNLVVIGAKIDDFSIKLEDKLLVVEYDGGERERKPWETSNFVNKYKIVSPIDQSGIVAEYGDGVLEIILPKDNQSDSKITIPIKSK